MGFESIYAVINNTNVYAITSSLFLLTMLLKFIVTRFSQKTKESLWCYEKITQIKFINFICGYINGIYNMLAVGFALNVRDLSFETVSLTICSMFAILNGMIVILYPIWLLLRLRQGRAL